MQKRAKWKKAAQQLHVAIPSLELGGYLPEQHLESSPTQVQYHAHGLQPQHPSSTGTAAAAAPLLTFSRCGNGATLFFPNPVHTFADGSVMSIMFMRDDIGTVATACPPCTVTPTDPATA
jgi:hypothetical protein